MLVYSPSPMMIWSKTLIPTVSPALASFSVMRILLCWLRVSARAVMDEDYGDRGLLYRLSESLPGMYQREGEGPLGYPGFSYQPVFHVEHGAVEDLFLKAGEPRMKIRVDILPCRECRAFADGVVEQPFAEFERSLQLGRLCLADTFEGADFGE